MKKIKDFSKYSHLLLTAILFTTFLACSDDDGPPSPETPTSLVVEAYPNNEVDLSWNDEAEIETGFVIERSMGDNSNFAAIGSVDPDSTLFKDSTITADGTYFYRVKAVNGGSSSGYSNEVSVSLPIPPPTERILGRWVITKVVVRNTTATGSSGGVSFYDCDTTSCAGEDDGFSFIYDMKEDGSFLTITYDSREFEDYGIRGRWRMNKFTTSAIEMSSSILGQVPISIDMEKQ